MEKYVTIKEAKEKYGIDLTGGLIYRLIGDKMEGTFIDESLLEAAKDMKEHPEKYVGKSEPKSMEELMEEVKYGFER